MDNRFAVPGFWPKPEETHRIPFDREEIHAELERLRRNRLERASRKMDAAEVNPREGE